MHFAYWYSKKYFVLWKSFRAIEYSKTKSWSSEKMSNVRHRTKQLWLGSSNIFYVRWIDKQQKSQDEKWQSEKKKYIANSLPSEGINVFHVNLCASYQCIFETSIHLAQCTVPNSQRLNKTKRKAQPYSNNFRLLFVLFINKSASVSNEGTTNIHVSMTSIKMKWIEFIHSGL